MTTRLENGFSGRVRALFANRKQFSSVLKNTFWIYLDRILRMVVSLVVGIWVTRYLGPEQYGMFTYAFALTGLAGVFIPLGIPQLVVRELAQSPEERNSVLGTSAILHLGVALVSACVIFAVSWFESGDDPTVQNLIFIFSVGLLLKTGAVFDYWFQSQLQAKLSVIAQSGALVLMAVARIVLLVTDASVFAFAWVIVAESLLNIIGQLYFYLRSGESVTRWRFYLARARRLLREGAPYMLTGLSVAIYMRSDQIMLRNIAGDEAAGIYAAAVRVSELWYFLPTALMTSMLPVISKAKLHSEGRYYEELSALTAVTCAVAISVALPMTFLSSWVISLLYGARFAASGPILALHIWAGLPISIGVATSPWIVNEGLGRVDLQRTLAGAVLNVLLNLWLIPLYQGWGAAVATLIAYTGTFLVWPLVDPRTRKLGTMQLNALMPQNWLRSLRSLSIKESR